MDKNKFLAHFTFWNKLHKSVPEEIYSYDGNGNIEDVTLRDYLEECIKILNLTNICIETGNSLALILNDILEGNGVTSIRSKYDDTLLYLVVDVGDLYIPTIAYDAENRKFVLTDEGSLREYVEDLKIDYYVDSGFIQ